MKLELLFSQTWIAFSCYSIAFMKFASSTRFNETQNGGQIYQDFEFFEGDIVPEYNSIKGAYGEDVAEKLVNKGMMEKPSKSFYGSDSQTLWNQYYENDVYRIDVYISSEYSIEERNTIEDSLKDLARITGSIEYTFHSEKPLDGRPFLNYGMHQKYGCASYIGRVDTEASSSEGQPVFLPSSDTWTCVTKGIIHHESLHALGFWHEQSRPDRDEYIQINWDNIKKGYEENFKMTESIDSLGSKYDYDSIMHYRADQFAIEGVGKTIIPITEGVDIGQREGLSNKDIIQVRLMYGCASGTRTLNEYKNKRCTRKCKCSEFQWGCGKGVSGDKNFRCKGNLKCKNNRCLKI